MGKGRPECVQISVLGPILPHMRRGSLQARTGKVQFLHRQEEYIFGLSITAAYF